MSVIQRRILHLLSHIRDCERKYGRAPGSVSMLAVSKKRGAEEIEEAIQVGQVHFGESYVQEARPKMSVLSDNAVEWHFIGRIQGNKAKVVAENFSWVHSVSSIKLAKALNKYRPLSLGPLNVFLQVNLDNELSKSGARENQLKEIVEEVSTMERLCLKGLMAIPLRERAFDVQLNTFKRVAKLQHDLNAQVGGLNDLSIGMSLDYEAAIAAGSTFVRLGTAIFGERC